MELLKQLVVFFWDFFSPVPCAVCGGEYNRTDGPVCPLCSRVAQPVVTAGNPSEYLSGRYFYFSYILSLFLYNSEIQSLIISFKEKERVDLASYFGSIAAGCKEIFAANFDVITAVPLSRLKQSERGYNQSELFARQLSRFSGKPYKQFLRCKGGKKIQKKLSYEHRSFNCIGRYDPVKQVVCPERVLLVDDVVTTGATLNECSRILKKMGALTVFSLTIARVDI
ncbi:MAG: hypothetical protein PF637_02100 [Spirochaetes bacterium]|jgi:competence protein ComFC|nr:hypothetical protein [Spirochaetota bacterium]